MILNFVLSIFNTICLNQSSLNVLKCMESNVSYGSNKLSNKYPHHTIIIWLLICEHRESLLQAFRCIDKQLGMCQS